MYMIRARGRDPEEDRTQKTYVVLADGDDAAKELVQRQFPETQTGNMEIFYGTGLIEAGQDVVVGFLDLPFYRGLVTVHSN